VLAADRGGVEHHVAVGVTADQNPAGVEHASLSAAGTGLKLEDGHDPAHLRPASRAPPSGGSGGREPELPDVTGWGTL